MNWLDIGTKWVYNHNQINPFWVKGGGDMFPNIDAERARIGMSKSDLAKELGVSYSTIKSWMSGKTEMPCSKVIAMSKLFGVSSDYLLGLTQHGPKSA